MNKKHRRWRMLWLGLKQLPKEQFAVWRNEQGHQVGCQGYSRYDRCWEIGVPYELINSRRRYRKNMVGIDGSGNVIPAENIF